MNHTAPSSEVGVATRSRGERIRARLCAGNDQGQSLVEFAVSLPVMLLVLTGIFAFGITVSNDLLLTNATAVAATQLAISRGLLTSPNYDPCAMAAAALYAAAPTLKQASFTFAFVLNGGAYPGTTCVSTSNTTGAAGNLVQGATAQITVTYPCSLRVYSVNAFPNCLLTATTSVPIQ